MYRFVPVVLAVMVLGGVVSAADPLETARGRWGALAAGNLEALVGMYAPGAEAFFAGTPKAGFLSGEDLESAWRAVLARITPGELREKRIVLFPRKGMVFAELSFTGGTRDQEGELRIIWAVALDPAGEIVKEDFLVYGLSDTPQPPRVDGEVVEGEFPHTVAAAGVRFSFLNGTLLLFGALRSPGTGWVAVGFAPDSKMKGANIVFGWVSGAETIVEDHFGSGPTSHRKDREQHILLAAGKEAMGETTIEFAIPLASGDPEDKDLVRGRSYDVILAYHKASDGFRRHTARGKARMTLD